MFDRIPRCIVHVGMHKTGTTSIQSTLHSIERRGDFTYMDLGDPNHSERVLNLFLDEPMKYRLNIRAGRDELAVKRFNRRTVEMIETSVKRCETSNMIISAEGISLLSESELMKMKEMLQLYFEKIEIVAYVREPASFMVSSLQQHIKAASGIFYPETLYPGYRKRLKKFFDIFSRENVRLWRFGSSDIVKDFSSRLGFEIEEEEINSKNETLTTEALSLLYIYRRYGPKYGKGRRSIQANQNLIKALSFIGENKPRLSPSIVLPILERQRKDIEWVEKCLGESLKTLPYPAGKKDIGKIEDLEKIDSKTIEDLNALLELYEVDMHIDPTADKEKIVAAIDSLKEAL